MLKLFIIFEKLCSVIPIRKQGIGLVLPVILSFTTFALANAQTVCPTDTGITPYSQIDAVAATSDCTVALGVGAAYSQPALQNGVRIFNTMPASDHRIRVGHYVDGTLAFASLTCVGSCQTPTNNNEGSICDAPVNRGSLGSCAYSYSYTDNNGETVSLAFTIAQGTDFVPSFTISGGAFRSAIPTAQQAASANRSTAAAFGRAANTAQNFITQTQIQNRLIQQDRSIGQQANLDGDVKQSPIPGGTQLAMAYGDGIKRPGRFTWHSKDIINSMRAKQVAQLRGKEQQARDGLAKFGVQAADEVVAPLAFSKPFDFWAAGGFTRIMDKPLGIPKSAKV